MVSKKLEVSDERYSIGLEFTGALHGKQQYVVRFCGDFIESCDGRGEAEMIALKHAIGRDQNRSGWNLVCNVQGVIWINKGKHHRVAYGADVMNFTGKDSSFCAAAHFGLCIHHAFECEGLI